MSNEIRNKVTENTNLITFNLENYYVEGKRILVDISQWLDQGFVLREQQFRASLKAHNFKQYQNSYIAVYCSTDAIVPVWAFMLFTAQASKYAKKVALGSLKDLETAIYQEQLHQIDVSSYLNKFVIIKGCSQKPVPESAYIMIIQKLQTVAKSVMYGEACSSVPLFKQ